MPGIFGIFLVLLSIQSLAASDHVSMDSLPGEGIESPYTHLYIIGRHELFGDAFTLFDATNLLPTVVENEPIVSSLSDIPLFTAIVGNETKVYENEGASESFSSVSADANPQFQRSRHPILTTRLVRRFGRTAIFKFDSEGGRKIVARIGRPSFFDATLRGKLVIGSQTYNLEVNEDSSQFSLENDIAMAVRNCGESSTPSEEITNTRTRWTLHKLYVTRDHLSLLEAFAIATRLITKQLEP